MNLGSRTISAPLRSSSPRLGRDRGTALPRLLVYTNIQKIRLFQSHISATNWADKTLSLDSDAQQKYPDYTPWFLKIFNVFSIWSMIYSDVSFFGVRPIRYSCKWARTLVLAERWDIIAWGWPRNVYLKGICHTSVCHATDAKVYRLNVSKVLVWGFQMVGWIWPASIPLLYLLN